MTLLVKDFEMKGSTNQDVVTEREETKDDGEEKQSEEEHADDYYGSI
jgi:hypothetical protein